MLKQPLSVTAVEASADVKWGECIDQPFGRAQRTKYVTGEFCELHPLAPKMQRVYNTIQHDPKMNNKTVRKNNRRAVEKMLEGVRARISVVCFNLAELYYNGAPGVHKDWNRTLELYIESMAAPDAAQFAAESEQWVGAVGRCSG